ncbi:MAG: Glu/Leu/Phe/Val dehydrogenase dimerization domain-containing protein, partial [Streptosporangiaceae bacterium]
MADLDHEEVIVRRGPRSGLPIIVALHSTALGQAVGGCRVWPYADWRDGLDDALRLSAGMTRKCAVAGLANGGGKTVVAVPEGVRLGGARRAGMLRDVGDLIASLDGRYATGPDAGTTPADMAAIGERTGHVFCTPRQLGGSGDSSPHTATGVVAALRAVCARVHGSPDLSQRRLAIVGLGSVGGHLARQLAGAGAELLISDIDPGKRALAGELGARWVEPQDALTADVDVVIPAALGGVLTVEIVSRLRCAAVAGPANNQLAEPAVAGLLHQRGIVWAPDYVVGAGGVIYALAVELHKQTAGEALACVQAIAETVGLLPNTAERTGVDPAQAAQELADRRLSAPGRRARHQPGG